MKRKLIRIAGLFKNLIEKGGEGKKSLGGYIDSLSMEPYSLGAAYLKSYCESLPAIREKFAIL
ncbi:MAG: hypothetical protein FJ088_06160, partial [Deltaproteobacteria bacterium]|nr:hypothetical protein [Deltaproteobacteria bacterium]